MTRNAQILYTLNLCDLCFTLHAISRGETELNPLMRNIPVMVAWKVLGVGFFCWVLNHFAEDGNMVARWGMRICTAAFVAVDLWHIANL
jgi:hypothetical protein